MFGSGARIDMGTTAARLFAILKDLVLLRALPAFFVAVVGSPTPGIVGFQIGLVASGTLAMDIWASVWPLHPERERSQEGH